MVDRNELWAEAEELADLLMQSPELIAYQKAERAMKANESALSMISELRDLQVQVGEFQSRNVPENYYAHLVETSESIFEKLEKISEVRQFQEAQDAVNNLLSTVTERLSQAVMTRISGSDEG